MNVTELINDEDLKLSDHEIYLKTAEIMRLELESMPPFIETQNLITRAINMRHGRNTCKICDGSGNESYRGYTKCLGCNGRGYN